MAALHPNAEESTRSRPRGFVPIAVIRNFVQDRVIQGMTHAAVVDNARGGCDDALRARTRHALST
jgi:hypothetical protein